MANRRTPSYEDDAASTVLDGREGDWTLLERLRMDERFCEATGMRIRSCSSRTLRLRIFRSGAGGREHLLPRAKQYRSPRFGPGCTGRGG